MDRRRRSPNGRRPLDGVSRGSGALSRDHWNASRFVPGSEGGHYESWFQRANHPERPLAFWIRYTIFAPRGRPEAAQGELWAMWFDGESSTVCAVKEEMPIASCLLSRSALDVTLGDASLNAETLVGEIEGGGHRFAWSLRYRSPEAPLLLLSPMLYATPLPKAKALVGSPNAVFDGTIQVDGVEIPVEGWGGSQNHNWGSQHTDGYAWGQVAAFDGAPESFFEVSTARLKLGRLHAPPMTLMVLRLEGKEYRLSSILHSLRARGRYDGLHWSFDSATDEVSVSGTISAPPETFVGLFYRNPPGGTKTCLNSKLARCQLTVRRPGAAPRVLTSRHRAAFEMLVDENDLGLPVMEVIDRRGGLRRGRPTSG